MLAKESDKDAAKPPISAHPGFPAIVALWFAVLFGVGSLVLPISLLEAVVTGTGMASLISAAAPPLGTTARIAIAIIAALAGAGIGLFLARKVSQANASDGQPVDKFDRDVSGADELPAKKPISAREELGSEFLDDPVADEDNLAAANDTRIDHSEAASPLELSEFAETETMPFAAPLSGSDEEESDVDDFIALAEAPTEARRPYFPEPEAQTVPDFGPKPDPGLKEANDMTHSDQSSGYNPLAALAADFDDDVPPFAPPPGAKDAIPAAVAQPFGMPQPAEIAEPELAGQDEDQCEDVAIEASDDAPAEQSPEVQTEKKPDHLAASFAGLSMTELVDRFALSLRNRAAKPAEPITPATPLPAALQPVEADDFAFDEAPEGEDLSDLALGEIALDDDVLEEGYSSLLAMKSSIAKKRDCVRVGEHAEIAAEVAEPVAVFPAKDQRRAAPAADGPTRSPAERPFGSVGATSQAVAHPQAAPEPAFSPVALENPAASQETAHEAALRGALEKLQRLSNAR